MKKLNNLLVIKIMLLMQEHSKEEIEEILNVVSKQAAQMGLKKIQGLELLAEVQAEVQAKVKTEVKTQAKVPEPSPLVDIIPNAAIVVKPAPSLKPDKPKTSVDGTVSMAVRGLKKIDSEKYKLLSKFEEDVRSGQILGMHDNIKKFGRSVSKEFTSKGVQKETISHLMAIIAKQSLEEITKTIALARAVKTGSGEDNYKKSSEYILGRKLYGE